MLHNVKRADHHTHHQAAVRTWLQKCIGSLFGNQIGAAGAQALAKALPSCVALTELKYAAVLSNVGHTVRDAHHPTAVRTSRQPCLDSLSENQIGAAGAQALAAALPSCVALS